MSDERNFDQEDYYDPGNEPLPAQHVSDQQMQQEFAAFQQPYQPPQQGEATQLGGNFGGGPTQAVPAAPQAPQRALPVQQPSYQGRAIPPPLPLREPAPTSAKKQRSYESTFGDIPLAGEPGEAGGIFAPPPPPQPSWFAQAGNIVKQGLFRANEGLGQSSKVATGQTPTASTVPQEEYEKPPELADFGSPSMLAQKALFGLAQSYPSLITGVVGSIIGTAAGGAIGGGAGAAAGGVPAVATTPIGAAIGGVAGLAIGTGLGAAFQGLGPAYLGELQALPPKPTQPQLDKAWDNTLVTVAKDFGVSAASMALFARGTPIGNWLKSFYTTPVVNAATGATTRAAVGLPGKVAVQLAGQPALSVAGQVGANVAQGKSADEGLGQAAAAGLMNVVPDALGRGVARIFTGPPRAIPINPDVELAARTQQGQTPAQIEGAIGTQGALNLTGGSAAQPRLDLTGGADTRPVYTSPETGGRTAGLGEVSMATGGVGPSRPGELVGAGDLTNQSALNLTGGRGPDQGDLFNRQTPQPPTPPVPRGVYPEGPTVQTPVPGLNRVNVGDTNVAAAAPLMQGAADIARANAARNISGQRIPGELPLTGMGGLTTPLVGSAMRPIGAIESVPRVIDPELTQQLRNLGYTEGEIARMSPREAQEASTTSPQRGATVQPGQGELGLPEGSYRPVGPTKYGTPTPEAVSPRPKMLDFSVERDHLDSTQWVAKNDKGEVAGKGPSQKAARVDAVARRGKPYAMEPGETAAAKAGEAAGRLPIVIEGTEGLGTAKATMDAAAAAAEGRHQEALAQQTPAEKAGIKLNAEQQETGMIGETAPQKETRLERLARGRETAKRNREAKAAKASTTVSVTKTAAESVQKKAPAEAVTEATEASAEKAPSSETVTKSTEKESPPSKQPSEVTEAGGGQPATEAAASEKAPSPAGEAKVTTDSKTAGLEAAVERAKAAHDEITQEWIAHRASKEDVADALRTYNAAVKALEGGERTKAGVFTMGEGADVVPLTDAERQRQSSGMASEAGAEMRQRSGLGSRAQPTEAVPWRPTEGASKIRQGQEIVTALLKGDITLDQAIGHYGTQDRAGPGRPRADATFTEVVRKALERAQNPKFEAGIRDLLKTMREKGITGGEEYKALVEQLNAERFAKENRAALAEYLKELEAMDRGVPSQPESAARLLTRVEEARSRANRDAMQYAASRPEVNEPLMRQLESRTSHRLHDLLDTILNTPAVKALTPQLHELAQVLRKILPNLEVQTKIIGDRGELVYGHYNPETGVVEISPSLLKTKQSGGAVMTLIHEGLHGATSDYVDHIFGTPEAYLTKEQLAHKNALQAIYKEVNNILASDPHLTTMDKIQMEYSLRQYENASPHELITQIFTRPEVSAILAKTRASSELRSAINRFGFGGKLRSVWDGFKNVMRDIFKIRSPDSVLDLILRPLAEITEVGARYRPEAIAARRDAIIASDHALGPRESRDDWSRAAIQKALTTAVSDKGDTGFRMALRGAMQGGTLHAIHDMIKPYVPSVTGHRDALERVTYASEAERVRSVVTHNAAGQPVSEPNIDKAMRLRREASEGPDARELNTLMTDTTLGEMSVIDPRRNAHLTTPAEINQQQVLQRRFDSLDPRAQQTYREINEYHNDIYRAEREAQVKNYVDLAFSHLSEADQNAMREQMRTRQGIMDVLNRPDRSSVAQRLGPRWADVEDLARLIANSQAAGFVDGDFFPLRRHGEYIVSAGEHNNPNYLVQMFETASEARRFREDLGATRNDVSQVFVKSQTQPRNLISASALSTLDRAMQRAGLSDNAQQVLRDMYAGQLIQQGTRQATRTMRREGIAGASVDQARNILTDFLAYTSRIGHLTHGAEVHRTWYQMDKEARMLHASPTGPVRQIGVDAQGKPIFEKLPGASEKVVALAQTGVEELHRRLAPADGDTSADLAGRGVRGLSTLTVLNTLMRPAHFFMQLAGTYTAATSMIAARHGLGGVGEVTKAFGQLARVASTAAGRNGMAAMRRELSAAHWDLAEFYRKRLQQAGSGISVDHANLLIDRMNQASLINHTWIREIQRLAGPKGFGDGRFNYFSRFLDVAAAGEHALDSMMRVATAKAAFVSELRKNGGNANAALDYAMQMARDSQPDYSRHNKSRIATAQGAAGRLAPLITQFKQFGLHMYGVQGNLLANAIRDPATRAESLKALAYLQGAHAVLFGTGTAVFGSVPAMVGLGMYDLVTGGNRPQTNQELETASRNWVRDQTGSKTFADIFAHGVPMAFGANVSRSLQFTNLVGIPELRSFDKPGAANLMGQVMTGASGDTVAGLFDGMSKIFKGDIRAETIAKILPRVVRDPLEAYVWGTEGLKTGRGQTIVPAEGFSARDLALKAAGFIPEVSSTGREVRGAINLAQLTEKDVKNEMLDRVIQAKPADRGKAMMEIVRYNASVPADQRITTQSIRSRITEEARERAMPQNYGMRIPKTDQRAMSNLTRFANP